MTYSGTFGTTITSVQQFIDTGARRAGKLAEELTVEQVEDAKRSLFLLLSHLAAQGINYWAIEKTVIGFTPNQATYQLPQGSIDVLQALYRTITQQTGTYVSSAGGVAAYAGDQNPATYCQQTSPNGTLEVVLAQPTVVTSIGILPYGSGTFSYVLEYSLDGVTWQTLYAPTSTQVVDNVWIWQDLDPAFNAQYYRIRAINGSTISVREFFLGNNTLEVQMSRLNRDDYTNLPNKGFSANQPYQYWFNRKLSPEIRCWPTPSNAFVQATVWYSRYVEDIGSLSNQVEVPQYMYEAIQMQLAHRMALSLPGVPMERILYCEKMAQQYLYEAEEENRDRSPIFISPNLHQYTA